MDVLLRHRLAAEAVTLLAVVAILVRFGASDPAAATLRALGAYLAAHTCVVVFTFMVSRRHAWPAPPELTPGLPSALRIGIAEWLAYLALFIVIQPFERLWMGADTVRPRPQGVPVLLIHGYLCNRGAWWWLRRRLRTRGIAAATITLDPPLGGIDGFVDQLRARIEALRTETGADRIALVGHSMGGLVARAYLRAHGPDRVAGLVTLGSPHHGTRLAHYGLGANARDMEPDSAWMRAMASVDPRVPMVSVWSPADNFVAPQDSSRLAGAREVILPALSHLGMLFSSAVLEVLAGELAPATLATVAQPAPPPVT